MLTSEHHVKEISLLQKNQIDTTTIHETFNKNSFHMSAGNWHVQQGTTTYEHVNGSMAQDSLALVCSKFKGSCAI